MADRSPLLNQMDRNSRLIMEDIYQKMENMRRSSKKATAQPTTSNYPDYYPELQSAPNVSNISTIVISTGTDRIDMADLNTQFETLAEELEIMRQGLNSALIVIRQLSG